MAQQQKQIGDDSGSRPVHRWTRRATSQFPREGRRGLAQPGLRQNLETHLAEGQQWLGLKQRISISWAGRDDRLRDPGLRQVVRVDLTEALRFQESVRNCLPR